MSVSPPNAEFAEEKFFDFRCPYCDGTVSFPASAIEQPSECPDCSETFIVPPIGSDKGRRFPIPIATPRLTLRRLQLSDCDDVASFVSEEELPEYMESQPMNEQQVREWVASDAKVRFTTPDQCFYLAIERNDIRRVIGWIALSVEQVGRKFASVAVVIARTHQRQGFGTEALDATLKFCFGGARLHRVAGSCDARNKGAARMFEKAGMRFEAQFREDRPDGFGWADTVWFAMLERECPAT